MLDALDTFLVQNNTWSLRIVGEGDSTVKVFLAISDGKTEFAVECLEGLSSNLLTELSTESKLRMFSLV